MGISHKISKESIRRCDWKPQKNNSIIDNQIHHRTMNNDSSDIESWSSMSLQMDLRSAPWNKTGTSDAYVTYTCMHASTFVSPIFERGLCLFVKPRSWLIRDLSSNHVVNDRGSGSQFVCIDEHSGNKTGSFP